MAGPRISRRAVAIGALVALLASGGAAVPAGPPQPPEWIWAAGGRDGDEQVRLRARFDVVGPLRQARLRCAADFCRVEIVLNGEPVRVVEDYAPWLDEDVTRHLRRGENTIELRCRGSAGPSAVAVSLDRVDAGGLVRLAGGPHWDSRQVTDASPATDESPATDAGREGWRPAVSFGPVEPELWGVDARPIEVTPFDDYEQWRRALDTDEAGAAGEPGEVPPSLLMPDGFEARVLRRARPDEGSWISLAFDPKGRPVVAREDKGLLRMTLTPGRDGVASVETIDDSLSECRGLLFAYDALYANANNSKGLYRLRDTDGDDRFDEVTLLREFPGDVGHGRNDLALGPDGAIYSIHGDDVDLPNADQPGAGVFDRTSPFREARRGARTREGHLLRTDRDGSAWELVASGLRNPFGIDFHPADGEPFTYDADAEHDMGAPWYRPTRVVQLVSGADYGWRGVTGSWPPYYPDRPDNALPAADIGKGSPTAVKFGRRSGFPPRFRDALFVLDWAYGRVLAVHLVPRGAGYTAQAEVFLSGRPLNVTDLDFGPDGALYLVTGGRKTESALYRVAYAGPEVAAAPPSEQRRAREAHSREMRRLRRRLEFFHGRSDDAAIAEAWPYLGHPDPVLRHAARVAVEHQPVAAWKERALAEERPAAASTALLALARAGDRELFPQILRRLNELGLTASDDSHVSTAAARAYSICLEEPAGLGGDLPGDCLERLAAAFRAGRPPVTPPTGLGGPADRELGRLLAKLRAPGIAAAGMARLNAATSQEERLDWLFVLRDVRDGWTPDLRRAYFTALNEAATFQGGRGMPGFLQTIRDEAAATLSQDERRLLGDLIAGPTASVPPAEPRPPRPLVRKWRPEDFAEPTGATAGRDLDRGRRVFHEAACGRCHRVGTDGSAVGPDLTSVARRFGRRDVLESILSPSEVVAEPYRNVEVVTADGRVVVGQVVTSGDYRDPVLRIAPDPLRPSEVVEIPKADVEVHRTSAVSPMPSGLLDTFERDEILDLLAFLESGGHRPDTGPEPRPAESPAGPPPSSAGP